MFLGIPYLNRTLLTSTATVPNLCSLAAGVVVEPGRVNSGVVRTNVHAQLNLRERRAATAHAAQLQIDHGPVVGHCPGIGEPCSTVFHYNTEYICEPLSQCNIE